MKIGSPELGPRPARRASRHPTLPATRESVLAALDERAEPISIAALATLTGLHVNTLREHLDALTGAGLVRRERASVTGRGRPAWLYGAVPDGEPAAGVAEYAGLASALAETIERTSSAPRRDAVEAGRRWGRQLAGDRAPERDGDARRHTVRLLDDLGFAPEPDARYGLVRLTRCPLLDAARRHPEVVCGVHLGIVRGALEVQGAEADGAELFAFSEPGACLLDLRAAGHDEPRP